ncbi:hypothetical protein TDB9533_03803 [Thalassocella blandensis]|nr:hypothetical protein TDB9533_03803 [Thalassocella blandensis]
MRILLLMVILSGILQACGGGGGGSTTPNPTITPAPSPSTSPSPTPTLSPTVTPTSSPSPSPSVSPTPSPSVYPGQAELPMPLPMEINTDDQVTLSQSTYTYTHWAYSLDSENAIESVNYNQLDTTVYDVWVMENRYLKVTLLPEYGGRILSIYNKLTEHEELYQNPVGSPYLNNYGIFYYDWLMVLGGIFPTFPEPEHGKTWLLPWHMEIVDGGGQIATIRMYIQDEINYSQKPGRYNNGVTNIICTFTVSLKAGRTAVDTVVTLENPTDQTQTYEYWTNTTLTPGSDPADPRATDGLEMVADISALSYGVGDYGILQNETPTWPVIKDFVNHEIAGIAYPAPDISNTNVWGAINHDNGEGIFRIADNTITKGLKIWTFGRDNTLNLDPFGNTTNDSNFERPYVELWAGISRFFFEDAQIAAESYFHIPEIYSPSVGLSYVTHASDDVLVNTSGTRLEMYFLTPDQDYRVVISQGSVGMIDNIITPDPANGNYIEGLSNPGDGQTNLSIFDAAGQEVLNVDF